MEVPTVCDLHDGGFLVGQAPMGLRRLWRGDRYQPADSHAEYGVRSLHELLECSFGGRPPMLIEPTWEDNLQDVIEGLMDIYLEKWENILRDLLEDFR